MDRLLRGIQAELVPDREPAPVLADEPAPGFADEPAPEAPPAAAPSPVAPSATPLDAPSTTESAAPPGAPEPQIQALTELSARLLASMRELLAGYERMLVGPSSPRPVRRAGRRAAESPDVTLSAAPFPNLDALHAFEQAVSRLPGVREVAVQGYEGTDRAILVVRLDQPNP
jgi:hypothetical protein